MSGPYSLWVAMDVLFILVAAVLVVYGEVCLIVNVCNRFDKWNSS